jgi:hypothetical protein
MDFRARQGDEVDLKKWPRKVTSEYTISSTSRARCATEFPKQKQLGTGAGDGRYQALLFLMPWVPQLMTILEPARARSDDPEGLTAGIFDVDGVLLASPHERAWRKALQDFADPARDQSKQCLDTNLQDGEPMAIVVSGTSRELRRNQVLRVCPEGQLDRRSVNCRAVCPAIDHKRIRPSSTRLGDQHQQPSPRLSGKTPCG